MLNVSPSSKKHLGLWALGIWGAVLLASMAANAQSISPFFTYQGRAFDANGTTPLTHTVSFKIQIRSANGACLLYEEQQNGVNLATTNGLFNLNIGSMTGDSKRTGDDAGLSMARIFSNNGTVRSADATFCPGGYSPTSGDKRRLRVTIIDGATTTTLTPDQDIVTTPYATVAETLQGFTPSGFIQVTGAVNQADLNAVLLKKTELLNLASLESTLSDLAAGSSSLYMKPSAGGMNLSNTGNISLSAQKSLQLGGYTTAQQATLVGSLGASDKGKTWFNTGDNQMYYWDGTTARAVGTSSAVSAVTASAPLVATGTTSVALSLQTGAGLTTSGGNLVPDFGTASGKVAQGNDTRFNPSFVAGDANKFVQLNGTGTSYVLRTASEMRTALGLGASATLAVGTTSSTVAAGDDSRIVGALPKAGGTMTGALTLATGTTTLSPLVIPAGTLKTTPAAGDFEFNGTTFFFTNGSNVRQRVSSYDASLTPSSGDALIWNGSTWAPGAVSSGTLPDATGSTKGGVIVGTGLGVSSGTISVAYGTGSGTAVQGNDARMNPAPAAGVATNYVRVNSGGTAYEHRTAAQTVTDLGLGATATLGIGTGLTSGSGNLKADFAPSTSTGLPTGTSKVVADDHYRLNPTTVVGDASKMIRVNATGSGYELRTAAEVKSDLGLGAAASLAVGTTSSTVAAGDDSRIVGALPKAGGTMTGALTLATGTTTLSPLVIPAGTLKTTPAAGDFEFNGTNFYFTNSSNVRQRAPAYDASLTPSNGDALIWNGSTWAPGAVSSGTLPDATGSTKGGVIVGTGLGVSSGTISVAYGTGSGTAVQGNDARMNPAPAAGVATNYVRVNSGGTAYEHRTAAQTVTDLGLGATATLGVGTGLTSGSGNLKADFAASTSAGGATTTNKVVADDHYRLNPATVAGDANKMIRVNATGTGYELRTATEVKSDLGLGTAAGYNVGTGNGNIPQLDGSGKLASSVLPSTYTSFRSTGITDNAAATAMTIDSSGKVGIGTTSPSSPLHIELPNPTSNYLEFTTDVIATDDGTFTDFPGRSRYVIKPTVGAAFEPNSLTEFPAPRAGLRFEQIGTVEDTSTFINFPLIGKFDFQGDVFASGSVGIGTTSPVAKLDVAGGIKLANDTGVCNSSRYGTLRYASNVVELCNSSGWVGIASTGTGASTSGNNTFSGSNTYSGTSTFTGAASFSAAGPSAALAVSGGGLQTTSLNVTSATTMAGNLNVGSGKFFVDSSGGKVGVGTSSPAAEFEVASSAASPNIRLTSSGASSASYPGISIWTHGGSNGGGGLFGFYTSRGTSAAPAATQAGDEIGALQAHGYGTSWGGAVSAVNFTADSTFTATSKPTRIGFYTTNANETSGTERMRIAPDGKVGIGTTGPLSPLHVVGSSSDTNPVRITGASADSRIRIENSTAASTSNTVMVDLGLQTSAQNRSVAQMKATLTDTTDATRNGRLDFTTVTSGSLGQPTLSLVNGNVGIGTSSSIPDSTLTVRKDQNNLTYIDLFNLDNGTSAGSIFRLITKNVATTGNTSADIVKYQTGGLAINNTETHANAYTAFGVGASERMRITSGGNVGIGVISPAAALDVAGGIKLANDSATCDSTKYGTLRYASNVVQLCNSSGWTGIASTSGNNTVSGSNTYSGSSTFTGAASFSSAGPSPALDVSGGGLQSTSLNVTGTTTMAGNLNVDSGTFYVDSSGDKVGIGNTSPGAKLAVKGVAGVPATTGTTQGGIFRIEQGTSDNAMDFGSMGSSPWTVWIQSSNRAALGTNNPLALNPNGGNVGIGTMSPLGLLHINKNSTAMPGYTPGTEAGLLISAADNAATRISTFAFGSGGNAIQMRYANGTAAAPTYPTTLSSLGAFSWQGWDEASSSWQPAAAMAATPDSNWSASARNTAMKFLTSSGTSGTSEKMRIDSNGNVGIGTTSPSAKLHVAGGQILSTNSSGTVEVNTAASIDWNKGNVQTLTTADCASTTFTNMLDGGTYTLVIKETGTTTCSFSHSGLTFHLPTDHGARTSGKHTVYTFLRAGTDVYASWIPGF